MMKLIWNEADEDFYFDEDWIDDEGNWIDEEVD